MSPPFQAAFPSNFWICSHWSCFPCLALPPSQGKWEGNSLPWYRKISRVHQWVEYQPGTFMVFWIFVLSCALLLVFTHLEYLVFLEQNQTWCLPYSLRGIGVWILQLAVWSGESSLGWVFERTGQGSKGSTCSLECGAAGLPHICLAFSSSFQTRTHPTNCALYLLETAIIKKSFCEQHAKALQSLTAHLVSVLENHVSNVGR